MVAMEETKTAFSFPSILPISSPLILSKAALPLLHPRPYLVFSFLNLFFFSFFFLRLLFLQPFRRPPLLPFLLIGVFIVPTSLPLLLPFHLSPVSSSSCLTQCFQSRGGHGEKVFVSPVHRGHPKAFSGLSTNTLTLHCDDSYLNINDELAHYDTVAHNSNRTLINTEQYSCCRSLHVSEMLRPFFSPDVPLVSYTLFSSAVNFPFSFCSASFFLFVSANSFLEFLPSSPQLRRSIRPFHHAPSFLSNSLRADVSWPGFFRMETSPKEKTSPESRATSSKKSKEQTVVTNERTNEKERKKKQPNKIHPTKNREAEETKEQVRATETSPILSSKGLITSRRKGFRPGEPPAIHLYGSGKVKEWDAGRKHLVAFGFPGGGDVEYSAATSADSYRLTDFLKPMDRRLEDIHVRNLGLLVIDHPNFEKLGPLALPIEMKRKLLSVPASGTIETWKVEPLGGHLTLSPSDHSSNIELVSAARASEFPKNLITNAVDKKIEMFTVGQVWPFKATVENIQLSAVVFAQADSKNFDTLESGVEIDKMETDYDFYLNVVVKSVDDSPRTINITFPLPGTGASGVNDKTEVLKLLNAARDNGKTLKLSPCLLTQLWYYEGPAKVSEYFRLIET